MLRQGGQTVLEVGLRDRLAVRSLCGLAAVCVPVGEQPAHRDQVEVGVQFLLVLSSSCLLVTIVL